MAYRMGGTHSCGVKDISGLNDYTRFSARALIRFIMSQTNYFYYGGHTKRAIRNKAGYSHYHMCYAWDKGKKTGARSLGQAKRLKTFKNYVETRGLGTCTITPPSPNPTHDGATLIQALTFTPDHEEMCKFARESFPKDMRNWDNNLYGLY